MDNKEILTYCQEFQTELRNILDWWQMHTIDADRGGFYGRIDGKNRLHPDAPKGLVLHARILWTFSAAGSQLREPALKATAQRAYEYLAHHFIDPVYGGAFWSLHAAGTPLDTRKQIYGLAFAIYGLAEYARLTGLNEPAQTARALFDWIETHSFDPQYGGYLEAVARDGSPLEDMRLSEKDRNDPKSMNTHLHILEAYANLYQVWPDPTLASKIRHLLNLFFMHIIRQETNHLALFFSRDWRPQTADISYGHDIEAAWLLLEAAEVLGDEALIKLLRDNAVRMAFAAAKGLDSDGGLRCEQHLPEKHWWPQAEAMVGFFNAWQLSGDRQFLQQSLGCWKFSKEYLLDRKYGEWHWGLYPNRKRMTREDKAGFWKCPYHTSRAFLELLRRWACPSHDL
jgi:mannobiose 2-epimerase